MDMKELKEKHPDLFAQVIEEGKKAAKEEAEGAFSQERQQFQAQLDTTNQKLSETLDRTAKMEKELALAREGQLKAEADKLFAEIFADSDIEPRLEPKVRNQINHSKFVKDDKLDVEAFTKAVEDEIKDWETRLPSSGVSGFSNPNDHDDDSDSENNKKFSEENKSITNDLLSRAGQTTSEK